MPWIVIFFIELWGISLTKGNKSMQVSILIQGVQILLVSHFGASPCRPQQQKFCCSTKKKNLVKLHGEIQSKQEAQLSNITTITKPHRPPEAILRLPAQPWPQSWPQKIVNKICRRPPLRLLLHLEIRLLQLMLEICFLFTSEFWITLISIVFGQICFFRFVFTSFFYHSQKYTSSPMSLNNFPKFQTLFSHIERKCARNVLTIG